MCAYVCNPDSPDLPEHIDFHSLIATIVHITNLNLVGLLIGGHHLGSPPGTVHARSRADDCYCREKSVRAIIRDK